MTRSQSRWVNVVIIALVVILRLPTLLPEMYNRDEGYYGIIANDTLDGGTFYRTAVDTKPPGIYYIYVAVFKVAGKNNLLAVHVLAILVVASHGLGRTADWRARGGRLGGRMEWHWLCRVRPCLPAGGHAAGEHRDFRVSFSRAECSCVFARRKKRGLGLDVPQRHAGRGGNLDRQPSAVNLGVMLACLAYGWLIPRTHKIRTCFGSRQRHPNSDSSRSLQRLAWYYQLQGNLHDAYLWAWAFAVRYVESETTFLYVLKRIVTVHLAVMLCVGPVMVFWYSASD